MRRKPYTKKGIKRVPCLRCGKPSSQSWQICSLNNLCAGVCDECDIALNREILKFMRIGATPYIIHKYKLGETLSDSYIKEAVK